MGIQGCQQKEEGQPGELNVCNIIVEDSLIWDPLISFPIDNQININTITPLHFGQSQILAEKRDGS